MSDLREDLDRALRAVPIGDAPVDRAKRDGRKIRTRRRVALLAGALAVAAVAAGYPALTGSSAAAPPAPATNGARHGSNDPKLTDGPGGKTTQAPDGLASANGVIASGTMGGTRWQVTVYGPNAGNPVPADPCFMANVALVGVLGANCSALPPANGSELNSATPVIFTGNSDEVTEAAVGEAAADVTYVIVNFSDGQRLKLIPVTAHGHRYVAWVAPTTMTVASVVAHLGGPYNDSGQTATAIPYDAPGQMPVFGQWQRPGQPVPVQATGVVAGGVASGPVNWSVLAHVGPWGSCMEFTTSGTGTGAGTAGYYCIPLTSVSTVALLGPVPCSVPGLQLMFGAAPAGATRVRISLSNGKYVTARPVTVGGDRLFGLVLSGTAGPTGWTTYDAAGQQIGSGKVPSGSASSTVSVKP